MPASPARTPPRAERVGGVLFGKPLLALGYGGGGVLALARPPFHSSWVSWRWCLRLLVRFSVFHSLHAHWSHPYRLFQRPSTPVSLVHVPYPWPAPPSRSASVQDLIVSPLFALPSARPLFMVAVHTPSCETFCCTHVLRRWWCIVVRCFQLVAGCIVVAPFFHRCTGVHRLGALLSVVLLVSVVCPLVLCVLQ